jgi:hypothetical protein
MSSKFHTSDSEIRFVQGSIVSVKATSVAREYPEGVALVSLGRPDLASVAIQNLDATKSVKFWHGLIPVDPLDPEGSGYLEQDPTSWTSTEISQAVATLSTFGETVGPGQYLEPFLTPNQEVYSYVETGTVKAHVKEG